MESGINAQLGSHGASPRRAVSELGEISELSRRGGFQLSDLLVPREHGAWGMVALPFITAAIVGKSWVGGSLSLVMLAAALATLSIFMLRTPLAALWRMESNARRLPPAGNRRDASAPAAKAKGA